jgi:hypothetical protein
VGFTGPLDGLVVSYNPGAEMAVTGAALIGEREHVTMEHRLVKPLTPFDRQCQRNLALSWQGRFRAVS